MFKRKVLFIILFFSTFLSYSQIKTKGIPFVLNHRTEETGASPNNFTVAEDDRGIMYFGNQHGLLEYDGAAWRLYKVSNKTIVRSIAIDNNRIYVGAQGELGYFEGNKNGILTYNSLNHLLPKDIENLSDVWRCFKTKDAIVFQTNYHIFIYKNGVFQTIKSTNEYAFAYYVNNRFLVFERNVGLLELINDKLIPLPKLDFFANSYIDQVIPFDNNKLLIINNFKGCYLYDGETLIPYFSHLNNFITNNHIDYAINIEDKYFALGSVKNGILIIDNAGKPVLHLNKATGLQSNSIHYIHLDKSKNLWLCLSDGIDYIEISSPFSVYNDRLNVPGTPTDVAIFNDNVYFGTNQGVFYNSWGNINPLEGKIRFSEVANSMGEVRSLKEINGDLLLGHHFGSFHIKNNVAQQISTLLGGWKFISLPNSKDHILEANYKGLTLLKKEGNEWRNDNNYLPGFTESCKVIEYESDTVLWMTHVYKGAYRILLNKEHNRIKNVKFYDSKKGFPSNLFINVFKINNELIFPAERGIYRYNTSKDAFEIYKKYSNYFDKNVQVRKLVEDAKGNIWFSAGEEIGVLQKKIDGGYESITRPFKKYSGQLIHGYEQFYPYDEKNILIVTKDQYVHFDPTILKDYNAPFKTYIREIITTKGKDSIIYGGNETKAIGNFDLDYSENALRFCFAATYYESKIQYSYMLEGFDKSWSVWSPQFKKDYTNLPEGNYTFLVKGKNMYDVISPASSFSFSISPPWYRSLFAYLCYIIAFAFFIVAILRYNTQRVQNYLKIEKASEIYSMKVNFFTNISHELKTPLTLILGPLERLMEMDKGEPKKSYYYNLILENANRLNRLISQVLELNKIESGNLSLKLVQLNLVDYLQTLLNTFSYLAEEKRINLKFESSVSNTFYAIDPDIVEKVIINLVHNAIKFTPENGTITLSVAEGENKSLVIKVTDNGVGIPEEKQKMIFNRFYLIEDTQKLNKTGTGLGLSLTKELIDLHKGKIELKSEVNKGSEFTITLPILTLSEENIVKPSENQKKAADLNNPILKSIVEKRIDAPVENEEDLKKEVILIIDDTQELRNFLKNELENNYKILLASNGVEGLKIANDLMPDLIISDVMMPGMNGIELTHLIKSKIKTCHIPVILLTAKGSTEDQMLGLETGADLYIQKPFNLEMLKLHIKNIFDYRSTIIQKVKLDSSTEPIAKDRLSSDEKLIQNAMMFIEKNLSNPDYNVTNFAADLGISRALLYVKIKTITGQAVHEFILNIRLKYSAQLLLKSDLSISEISYEVGFNDPKYFSKVFKSHMGKLPTEYQKEFRKE